MFRMGILGLLLLTGACVEKEVEVEHTTVDKEIIQTDDAPGAIGVYSQAIRTGNTLYLAGQIGLVPDTGELAGDDLESQTRQTIENIESVLEAAGYELEDVVKMQVYLSDLNDYGAFNAIYQEYFTDNPPARAVVEVSRIPLDAKVEMMATAVKTD